MHTTLYRVENLIDQDTADMVIKAVSSLEGVLSVTADCNIHLVSVTHNSSLNIKLIVYLLRDLGCPLVIPFYSPKLTACVFNPPYPSLN